MRNRQPTSLTSHNPTDNTFSPVSNMNFDMYQFRVLYQFLSPERKLRPYPATVANKAEQGQVNIGLIYRFGK
jgi:hypothetical protein